jgi:acyl-CoA thioesterase-1
MGSEHDTWPAILARRHAVDVRDHSQAGATARSALKQAEQVTGSGSLVLVEIGGNDVLGETTPGAFEQALDDLLAVLGAHHRTVVMLELPLPPFSNRYGAAQRRQAARHGVFLVPKRVLMGILSAHASTLDTIHLSPSGHAHMAEVMWHAIRGALGS